MRKIIIGASIAVISWSAPTLAQTQGQQQAVEYTSQIDQDLTIRRVSLLPVTDNLDGIYSRPLEAELTRLLKANPQWDLVESTATDVPGITDLEENSASLLKTVNSIEADAFFACRATKGPSGVSIRLDLFLKVDGKLFSQEILKDFPRFEIADLKEQLGTLYRKVVAKIPYNGLVMSRQGNRVTLSLGKADGITKDQMLSVIQIIKANRHPKFGFLVSTEKEILGKIKVLKVDDTLSFGTIVSEKERGAIKRFSKISGIDFVTYAVPDDYSSGSSQADPLQDRGDSKVSFGKAPSEWLPTRPPAFGKVGVKVGLGTYTGSTNLVNTNSTLSPGNLQARSSVYPSISLFAEMWINPHWEIHTDINQGVISTSNPRTGATPGTLSLSMSRYDLTGAYNFLLKDDFFGPKIQIISGFMTYRMYVDASQPEGLNTVNYSGMVVGLRASLPTDERKDWYFGAQMNVILFPNVSDEPEASGTSANSTINDFSIFGEKRISQNLRGVASLDFSLYSTSFSGPGARSNADSSTSESQKLSTLTAGVAYLF